MYAPDMHTASAAATVEHSTDRQEAQAEQTTKGTRGQGEGLYRHLVILSRSHGSVRARGTNVGVTSGTAQLIPSSTCAVPRTRTVTG